MMSNDFHIIFIHSNWFVLICITCLCFRMLMMHIHVAFIDLQWFSLMLIDVHLFCCVVLLRLTHLYWLSLLFIWYWLGSFCFTMFLCVWCMFTAFMHFSLISFNMHWASFVLLSLLCAWSILIDSLHFWLNSFNIHLVSYGLLCILCLWYTFIHFL